MNDEANFHNALSFNGFRFAPPDAVSAAAAAFATKGLVDKRLATSPEKLTDISTKYLVWGYGADSWYVTKPHISCPASVVLIICSSGRMYASCVMKMILAHLLMKYDFKLENPSGPHTFTWRTFIVPKRSAKLLLRERIA